MIVFQKSPLKATEPYPNNILIIKMSSLGDVIHALPSLAALRALYPKAQIHWVVEADLAPLLPGPPFLDKIIVFPRAELKISSPIRFFRALNGLRRQLKEVRYDLSIDFQALAKSSLVAFLAGAQKKLAYWETREGSFLVSKGVKGPNANDHVIQRYLDVIRYLGPVAPKLTFPLPDFTREKTSLNKTLKIMGSNSPRVIFCPGASWPTKLWPPENYAALAGLLAKEGYSLVLAGGPLESALALRIKALAPRAPIVDLTGQTDLRGLMALATLGQLIIGSDSGPTHVAAATGRPTISLYGPNNPQRTGVWGPLAHNILSPAPCAPCFKKDCPKDFICMERLTVETVFAAAKKALNLTENHSSKKA
ncbi:MAG: lipopolysaccharide heptosyltransferase II [Deltaproteobacteria bacterium]|jgi:heptosyltransferase-1/heptosyltransferase-2|nr:lipopolysaccharide heptosyltransferase II [Deltaproteobacteria bacterium]